jgi:hypothetical protein
VNLKLYLPDVHAGRLAMRRILLLADDHAIVRADRLDMSPAHRPGER